MELQMDGLRLTVVKESLEMNKYESNHEPLIIGLCSCVCKYVSEILSLRVLPENVAEA